MSKKDKLIEKLKSKSRAFTYGEAETLLLSLGFAKSNKGRTSGSRVAFELRNIDIEIHKPHPQKELPEYQIKKIMRILESERLI